MRHRLLVLGSAVVLALSMAPLAAAQVAMPTMVGRWRGEAQIVVDWTKARTIPVDIWITANDRVTGIIGDATLVDGVLRRNRGWLGRALDVKTDYLVEARLEGPLLARENIVRASVKMPMNFRSPRWVGSLHSSGTPAGGATSMIFTATFTLYLMPTTILCDTTPARCASP